MFCSLAVLCSDVFLGEELKFEGAVDFGTANSNFELEVLLLLTLVLLLLLRVVVEEGGKNTGEGLVVAAKVGV